MTLRTRALVGSGQSLSQITYGSMRIQSLTDDGLDPAHLLIELHDAGITTHHSSSEYPNHLLYLEGLAKAKDAGRNFQHIVKVADPSFDDECFDQGRLVARIDAELSTLRTERIESVQWLFRTGDVHDTKGRIERLAEQRSEIAEVMQRLCDSGKVGEFSCFPYNMDFAAAAATLPIGTLTTYLNLFERGALQGRGDFDNVIAIRPFAGSNVPLNEATEFTKLEQRGLITADACPYEVAITFPLLSSWVSTVIVSANSAASRELAVRAGEVLPDDMRFFEMESCLQTTEVVAV